MMLLGCYAEAEKDKAWEHAEAIKAQAEPTEALALAKEKEAAAQQSRNNVMTAGIVGHALGLF